MIYPIVFECQPVNWKRITPMKLNSSLPRRHVIGASLGTLAAAGLATFTRGVSAQSTPLAAPRPLPTFVNWKDPSSLIVHSSSTMETKRSAFGTSVITPAEQLYVRNNLPAPDPSILTSRDAWEINVVGVKNPRKLTVAQLKSMGLDTVAMVLQCSGNGRGFFPSKPSGTPWTVGAAGCVVWSGVPVRDVVEALGGLDGLRPYMTGTGGEKLPEGIDPKSVIVERSVPVAAMADAMLAWEMNGAPISLAHGGPLRLIVPGYTGVNNIKYIKQLAFTNTESDARIMSHGYRVTPPGAKADPSQPSVQEMTVKSWINSPSGEGSVPAAGLMQIQGVAFGGMNAVKKVEQKNINMINEWAKQHPECENSDTRSNELYMKLSKHACDGEDENISKVIKHIAKEIVIERNSLVE